MAFKNSYDNVAGIPMQYIEAPNEFDGAGPSIFLAGGITGCPNWQREITERLKGTVLTVLNPLRENFPMDDPNAAEEQIRWEHRHLRKATAKLFWFPCETLCPIALYELGTWSQSADPLFVGVHPDYQRRVDVEIQTRLACPDVNIVDSLADLAGQVLKWCTDRGLMGE